MSTKPRNVQTRRKFVGCSACALLVFGCSDKESAQQPTDSEPDSATEDSDFDPCQVVPGPDWVQVSLQQYPALQNVGGYVTTNVAGNSMVIAHVSEGCYAAVSSSCTHQGGNIYYSEQRQQFSCQLHAATFNLDGEWALGQVAANLRSFLVARDGDQLLVMV